MEMNKFSDLNTDHKDVLKEIGNIGTGNALTSLSQLIQRPIRMELPDIKVIKWDTVSKMIDRHIEDDASVRIQVVGDIDCVMTFILNEQFTKIIAEELTGEPVSDIHKLTGMQRSAICEVGNIMCNSYLNALASMLGMVLEVSVPYLDVGDINDHLKSITDNYIDNNHELLIIENKFVYEEKEFTSNILLNPRLDSLLLLLERLAF